MLLEFLDRRSSIKDYPRLPALPAYLLKAGGTNMGRDLLRVNRANGAHIELETALTAPVIPQGICTQRCTQGHEQV